MYTACIYAYMYVLSIPNNNKFYIKQNGRLKRLYKEMTLSWRQAGAQLFHFSNPTSFKLRSHNFLAASSSWAPLEGSLMAQSARYLPLTPSISSATAQ